MSSATALPLGESKPAAASAAKSLDKASSFPDLYRDVFGLFGVPLDLVDVNIAVAKIKTAASQARPYTLSTPNLNHLVLSQGDPTFRESLLQSDLCTPDGMALIGLSKLIGIPIRERVAGSDLFDVLKRSESGLIKVFLFGGRDGLAEIVGRKINAESRGVACVGTLSPGFGTVEELSRSSLIDEINASDADLIVVALNAKKGQDWILRNNQQLTVPVRASLGATLNFQAGTIRRAPLFLQKAGFEWLWRIKEEPYLWRRYIRDGTALLRILLFRALPLIVYRLIAPDTTEIPFIIASNAESNSVRIEILGRAIRENIARMIPVFDEAISNGSHLVVDLARTSQVDNRFFGLLVMVRKVLTQRGLQLKVISPRPHVKRLFKLNGFGFLLNSDQS